MFEIFTLLVLCSITSTDGAIEIPLSEIWGHDMPGTRRIAELMDDPQSEDSLMGQIGKAHSYKRGDKPVGPGLAVEGTGTEALKNAHAVITGKDPRPVFLSKDQEVSLAFFTMYTGYYIHVKKVTLSGNTIRIRYEFLPHISKDITQHFALIPLGRLHKGEFEVEIVGEPLAQKYIDRGWKEFDDEKKARVVSSSFKFEVR
jgi:hypothetical protein